MPKSIAIDLDGVLHRYADGWQDGTLYDRPMPGAVEAVRKLKGWGYPVVVFTARTDLDAVRVWLKRWGFPEDLVVMNRKPLASVYIDDRGYRFTSWTTALADLPGILSGA